MAAINLITCVPKSIADKPDIGIDLFTDPYWSFIYSNDPGFSKSKIRWFVNIENPSNYGWERMNTIYEEEIEKLFQMKPEHYLVEENNKTYIFDFTDPER